MTRARRADVLYALLHDRADLRLFGYISFRMAMAALTAFALALWWGKHVIHWLAANKVRGVRAAVCHDCYSAHQGVEHDDMNVLVLGGRIVGPALARDLVRAFLQASFSGEERHVRRLAKVKALEGGPR